MLNADSMAWLMLILPPLAPWLGPFTTHSVGALTMTHAGGESAGRPPRRTRSTVTRLSAWSQNSCCLFRLPHMSLSLCQPAAPAGGTPAVSGQRWWGRGRCGGWRACGARGTTAFRPAIRAGDPRRAATPGLPQGCCTRLVMGATMEPRGGQDARRGRRQGAHPGRRGAEGHQQRPRRQRQRGAPLRSAVSGGGGGAAVVGGGRAGRGAPQPSGQQSERGTPGVQQPRGCHNCTGLVMHRPL